ncbi:unnamed protein product [Pleuronectes platessa]|uniref:Uncharacterized protein n=1 Tax=Pleuronectes platessa TaxID=8262 RepID=A0A9N7TPU9_PLEPL|nr:unnamed protein product [Pleuronectes platessa]
MAADNSETRTGRRRPAAGDVCPVIFKCLKMDGQASVFRQDRKSATVSKPRTGSSLVVRTHLSRSQEVGGVTREELVATERNESSEDELGRLDIDLDRKSRQHNLTSSNVRAILHEVITHEHVVAMMKTAIRETQDLPMFEPKMTRSRLKQVVQEGQPLNAVAAGVCSVL